jgi:hypothetical protein
LPFSGSAAILADGDQLVLFKIFDGTIGATVEIVKIGFELRGSHGGFEARGKMTVKLIRD